MTSKLIIAIAAACMCAVSLSAQNNNSGFEQFKKEREAGYDRFAKEREEEYRKFKAQYENAFAEFKKNYLKALEEEEGIIDLMASDDDIPIVPVSGKIQENIYPVVSTSAQQKKIVRADIEAVSKLTPESLLPALSEAEDTLDQMRQAAETMETIARNMSLESSGNNDVPVPESAEVVLEPYNGPANTGREVTAQAMDADFLAMLTADAERRNAEAEVSGTRAVEEKTAAPAPHTDAGLQASGSSVESSVPHGKPTEYTRISSPFGTRIHPITRKKHTHKGIDMAAPKMTPIYASADGVVTFAKYNGGYGNFVKVNHENGYKTAYAHMHRIAVKKGDKVNKGDLIGYVGTTGSSTGNHLHYEVYYQDKLINPADTL